MNSKVIIFVFLMVLAFQCVAVEKTIAAQKNWIDISTTTVSSSTFEDRDDTDKVLVEKKLEKSTYTTLAFYIPF